jgi:hypothetical protein
MIKQLKKMIVNTKNGLQIYMKHLWTDIPKQNKIFAAQKRLYITDLNNNEIYSFDVLSILSLADRTSFIDPNYMK